MNRNELMETYEFKECGFKIVTCPICGNETLDSYWICDNCDWEYDGTINPNDYSECNHSTINNYKLLFESRK